MAFLKQIAVAKAPEAQTCGVSSFPLYQPLENLLAGGGDHRLALSRPAQQNMYGCTPFPRPQVLNFASSTASSISEAGYAAAERARMELLRDAIPLGISRAFDGQVEKARAALRRHWGLGEVEIIFSPSGTDAQLQALFLVKAVLGKPLTCVIAGADQTGSGTSYTAGGRHFSDSTAQNISVQKGAPVSQLADQVRSIAIGFCDEAGQLRAPDEMDEAVSQAVADAIARGEKVLLQAMNSSKLGWSAPSLACLDRIAAAWPQDVRVVMDACQMRLGRARLRQYLARNFLVLITGSKFFTGPPFSGAVLVPPGIAAAVDGVTAVPSGLTDYCTRFDWPVRWPALRAAFPEIANFGQWLRWEAALEEMAIYFTVPRAFREAILECFALQARRLIAQTRHLVLLPDRDQTQPPSIIPFLLHRRGVDLTAAESAAAYRAMGRDMTHLVPGDAAKHQMAARLCQIGQPVALRHTPGAALRISASARLVARCGSRGAATPDEALTPELADLRLVIEKLDWLAGQTLTGEMP
jgi:hypothetical protein